LRKYLIAVIAALAALAMATVAVAQSGDVTATTTVSPTKSGTKKKPRSIKVTTFVKNNIEGTSASKIEIDFPKTVKISGKGLTSCKLSAIQANGPTACPSKSKAGSGLSHAVVGPDRIPLNFDVTTYVAGKNLLAFYLQQQGTDSGVQQALPAKITKSGKGQKLTIGIPENLQQPAPGVYSALQQIKNSLGLKSGKNALVTSVGCSSKKHKIGVKITYVPNPTPPATTTASDSSNAKCSK